MKEKTIFWAVDCQKDFMLTGGKLYIKDAERILPNLSKLTSFAVKNNIFVVSTGDYHCMTDKEISSTPDYIKTFPPHCLCGEEGMDFVNETYPKLLTRHYYTVTPNHIVEMYEDSLKRAKDVIIYKNKFDVFEGNIYTDKILKVLKPEIIVVYGVATDYCVRYALEGLYESSYKIILVKDAIKGINEEKSSELIEKWKNMNIKIVSTDDIIEGRTNMTLL